MKVLLLAWRMMENWFPTFAVLPLQIISYKCGTETRYMLFPTNYAGSQKTRIIYQSFVLVVKMVLPAIVTLITTFLLVVFLYKKKKFRKTLDTESHTSKPSVDQLDDLTVCLEALAVYFSIFLPPLAVVSALVHTNITDCTYLRGIKHVVSLTLTNSGVNFFIYYWKLSSLSLQSRSPFVVPGSKSNKSQILSYSLATKLQSPPGVYKITFYRFACSQKTQAMLILAFNTTLFLQINYVFFIVEQSFVTQRNVPFPKTMSLNGCKLVKSISEAEMLAHFVTPTHARTHTHTHIDGTHVTYVHIHTYTRHMVHLQPWITVQLTQLYNTIALLLWWVPLGDLCIFQIILLSTCNIYWQ